MANCLICRVCEGKVSSDAQSCPHCSDPYVTEEKKVRALALEKYNRLTEQCHKLVAPDTAGSCLVCRSGKEMIYHDNSTRYYFRPTCKCSVDEYSLKFYGKPIKDIVKEAGLVS